MSRLAVLVAAVALSVPLAGALTREARAAETTGVGQPMTVLTWPGKTQGGKAVSAGASTNGVTLPKPFFTSAGDDLAAAPPPLNPRPVPGTQAATSSANTASNRARQNEILTADSAADGPVAGAESPN